MIKNRINFGSLAWFQGVSLRCNLKWDLTDMSTVESRQTINFSPHYSCWRSPFQSYYKNFWQTIVPKTSVKHRTLTTDISYFQLFFKLGKLLALGRWMLPRNRWILFSLLELKWWGLLVPLAAGQQFHTSWFVTDCISASEGNKENFWSNYAWGI